jgi:hypothetical protein
MKTIGRMIRDSNPNMKTIKIAESPNRGWTSFSTYVTIYTLQNLQFFLIGLYTNVLLKADQFTYTMSK